jgi:hypothetical protein
MRYNSTADAHRLRRASLGPVAASARRQYALPVPGRGIAGLSHEKGARVSLRGFGALGTGNTTSIVGGAAQGAAVGTTILPGIGTAVGAVVGAISGLFTGKSNPQIQIDKTSAITYFSQYVNVAGTVAGRTIGINNMDMVFRGACFNGHFPKWGNSTELPDSLLSMPGSPYGNNDNCFAVLWQAARSGNPAPGSSGKNTGNGGVPVRDAMTFVNKYVWPSNTADVDTNPWATTTDSVGRQIIIDAADAYLAVQDPTTFPVVGSTVQQPTNALPAPTTASATPSPVATNTVAASASPDGTYTLTAGGSVTDNTGVVYALTSNTDANGNYLITVGGTQNGSAHLLYKTGGQVYACSTAGWFVWSGTAGWIPTPEPAQATAYGFPASFPLPAGSTTASTAVSTAPAVNTTTATTASVSSTPPDVGATINYVQDNATGKMVALPTPGIYAGQTTTGGWLVTYTNVSGVPNGTYDCNNGALTLYGTATGTVPIPAGYTQTAQSALISGSQYPLYSDVSGNLYVWSGGTMIPYSTAASALPAATTTSSSAGGGGYYPVSNTSSTVTPATPIPGVPVTGDNNGLWIGAAALGLLLLLGNA